MKVAIAAAAAVFVVIMARSAQWAGLQVLWVGLVMLALGWLALGLYHHRKMAELHDLEPEALGGWRRVKRSISWPKYCRHCGTTAYDWRQVRTHTDPAGSVCAAYQISSEKAPIEPEKWTAAPVRGDGAGAGAVDTLAEGNREGIEA